MKVVQFMEWGEKVPMVPSPFEEVINAYSMSQLKMARAYNRIQAIVNCSYIYNDIYVTNKSTVPSVGTIHVNTN